MSHEGIRFIRQDKAQREDAAVQKVATLPVAAVTPLKVRVKKTEGTGVEIDWRDGHQSAWNFRWLRDACPCATCHAERESAGRAPGEPQPKSTDPLALYQAPPRPDEITPIGKYALGFKWNDGHNSGIYSWTYLRSVCQCATCKPPSS
jgi:DUF971 family protein